MNAKDANIKERQYTPEPVTPLHVYPPDIEETLQKSNILNSWKIVDFRLPKPTETVIVTDTFDTPKVVVCNDSSSWVKPRLIVRPYWSIKTLQSVCHVTTVAHVYPFLERDLNRWSDEFEPTGEFHPPQKDEYFLAPGTATTPGWIVHCNRSDMDHPRLIMKRRVE